MNDIILITAFFEIDRHDSYKRHSEKYLEYFSNWSRMQNTLIVFCQKKYSRRIFEIRKNYNLDKLTFIIEIDDFKSLDIDLYNSIYRAMENKLSKDFMLYKNNPEVTNVDYNYIMCIKSLLVSKAIMHFNITGCVAWIDFGFNHNLKNFKFVEDFDFKWTYDFDEKYIHLFNVKLLPDLPVFEIIRRMDTIIQGGMIVANSIHWDFLWTEVRSNMIHLNKIGLYDDDQILYLLAYNNYPEKFQLHHTNWNQQLKLFGGNHMRYSVMEKKHKFIKRFLIRMLEKYKNALIIHCYIFRLYKNIRDL